MGWTPQAISLLIVELMSALALATLWFRDRERSYTLWWAVAHGVQPLPIFLAGFAPAAANPLYFFICLLLAVQAVSLVAGVISYRTAQLKPRSVLIAIVALTAFGFLPSQWFGTAWGIPAELLLMAAALMISSLLMWSLGIFERMAAGCFALRAAMQIGSFVFFVNGHSTSAWFNYLTSFGALATVGAALSLLIAAYQRLLDRLGEQYRILELAQDVAAELQGAIDEANLAHRVLEVMGQRLGWKQGLFLRLVSEPCTFLPLASYGFEPGRITFGVPLTSSKEGLISIAIRSRRATYSPNLIDDPRVGAKYRSHPSVVNFRSQVVTPITHDGKVLGVLVVRDSQQRELRKAEIRTFESLGQIIGLSLTNANNLSELAYRANHDTLTGLGNRSALHDYLRTRCNDHIAVLLFDLDHFKQVNDALGHAVGDKLLRAMADRLQQFLRERPSELFRLGGDEFVIVHLLGNTAPQQEAQEFARSVMDLIAQPLQISGLDLRTPASVGVALAPYHGNNSHELLRCADVAMYHAKQLGAGITFYDRDIDANKVENLTLLSSVNEGLEANQFVLFYQPIINLATQSVDGCEALIRWNHPIKGLLGAAEFVPLVEATDLIRALTHRVIDIAMTDIANRQQRGMRARVAINLSARNILDPELPRYLMQAAERHQIEPRWIQLEITETILIKDPASAGKVLQELVEMGFLLALDDFGTGYSSMAYLARFPIHTLKIDRSFVRAMLDHSQSRAIVESTIALARGLGLKVTAEGVEHEDEVRALRELGCDYAQGYLFSPPIPDAALLEKWTQFNMTAVS